MSPDLDRETKRAGVDADLDALAEVEADAAEASRDVAELEEIDEALQEGWQEYAEEEDVEEVEVEELEAAEPAEEAEPELTLDHLLRFEEGPDGKTEVDERRAQLRVGLVNEFAREAEPDEFLCRSCFLLKKRSQLADARAGLCRDCVDPA